ncbi:A/G-specific adenine glycosylase [Methylovirgula sp. HY1]|uniref:A/G-specific adenine glycosylase n=1 Tax=Methylovirgula sp. HY1 TaxID=2822761 RepID=UPI001C5BAF1D|nr:A/G-specific adenine glycosylase [Methylovirgula sp. HY1]QXX73391.1 Adenine DNA glycosylase [Methylovirgula sp. HY1]
MALRQARKTKQVCAPVADAAAAAAALLVWYDRHRRSLPWRALAGEAADPYAVWLSEIMLQQTTVAAVKSYFTAFLARWPTIAALAAAPVEAVMQQWAGLGYYSRARNLHACAQMIATQLGGRFPTNEAGLLRLPGIGSYTAAAIAAIAFDEKVAVVDGNVERVISRLVALEVSLPAAKPLIKEKTAALVPAARPGDFAQAMMDLGATICTPRRPACGLCPLQPFCLAATQAVPERFPLKAPKRARPNRQGAVFFTRCGDAVLLRTRPPRGLLGGMAEFPGTAWSEDFDRDFDEEKVLREAPFLVDYCKLPLGVTHVFTHFSLRLAIFAADVAPGTLASADCRWVNPDALATEALPSVMRKVLAAIKDSGW